MRGGWHVGLGTHDEQGLSGMLGDFLRNASHSEAAGIRGSVGCQYNEIDLLSIGDLENLIRWSPFGGFSPDVWLGPRALC